MLCHCVVLDPRVSLSFASVAEARVSVSVSCSISSTASLFRGSPIPQRSTTRRFMSLTHTRHCVVPSFVWHCWLSSSLAYTLVSLLHAGVSTIVNSAISLLCFAAVFLLGEASFERLHSCSCFLFFFDLALCLVVSGHATTQTCAQGSTGLHVWWSLSALSLVLLARLASPSRLPLTTVHREVTAPSSLEMVRRYTCGPTFGFFRHFGLSFLPLRYGLSVYFGLLLAGLPAQDSDHLSYDQRSSLSR